MHALDVRSLALDVEFAHEDFALEAQKRRHGRRRDAVHAGARFGDQAFLAHAFGEERLADRVVYLVRAGVVEVLSLQIDLRAAHLFRQTLGEIERGSASHVIAQ